MSVQKGLTNAPDLRLGIWVPVEMEESHTTALTVLTGKAAYRNCRRFEVTARIKND